MTLLVVKQIGHVHCIIPGSGQVVKVAARASHGHRTAITWGVVLMRRGKLRPLYGHM
jgi:hypothetical protein